MKPPIDPARTVIPQVTCPACGNHMRLSTIMPEGDHRERIIYDCTCGFDFRQSQAVMKESGL